MFKVLKDRTIELGTFRITKENTSFLLLSVRCDFFYKVLYDSAFS